MDVEESFNVLLNVNVEANPPPSISWQMNGEDIVLDDRIVQLKNGSLEIKETQLTDAGTWTVIAENGLGQIAKKQISISVHPSRMPIEVNSFKFINF